MLREILRSMAVQTIMILQFANKFASHLPASTSRRGLVTAGLTLSHPSLPYGVDATFRGTVSHQKNIIKQPFNLTAPPETRTISSVCVQSYARSVTVTRFCKLLTTIAMLSGRTCLKCLNGTTPLVKSGWNLETGA